MQRSYAIISPRDFEIGRLHAKKVNVLLTFDDGYETWVTDVLPQLQQRNLSAIFFVNSGFVDTHGDRRAEHAFSRDNIYSWTDTPLSWEQVRKAAAAGIAIGGHGRLHRAASLLTDAELPDEISEDREIIATKIASAPIYFAYPFGILTQAARYHVRAAGYEYAFATHSGFVRAFDLPYSIPRSNTGVCSPLVMRAWVWGAHDLLHALVQKIKHPRGRPSSI
jgi:peptidoglycan/xylan/chitin deacetylase (PgdA/CDA1 family)